MTDYRQRTSLKGKVEMARHESVGLTVYRDSVKVPTIGIGITAAAGASINPQNFHGRIDLTRAVALLDEVLPKYEKIVTDLVGPVTIPQPAFDALVSLAWNIGPKIANPRYAPNTIRHARAGRYVKAIKPWNKAGGMISPGLVKRRHKEAMLAEYGLYGTTPILLYEGRGPKLKPKLVGKVTEDVMIAEINMTGRCA